MPPAHLTPREAGHRLRGMSKALLDLPAPTIDLPLPEQKNDAGGLLKRLSARHHRLAQCLAEGIKPSDAAAICGYTVSRVSVLQSDQVFGELVAFYAAKRQEAFVSFGQKLADIGETALDLLQDRLEEEPHKFTNGELQNVLVLAADRSGHGPSSTTRNLNVTLDGAALAELKRQTLESQRGTVVVIPAQPSNDSAAAGESPSDAGPEESAGKEGTSV